MDVSNLTPGDVFTWAVALAGSAVILTGAAILIVAFIKGFFIGAERSKTDRQIENQVKESLKKGRSH